MAKDNGGYVQHLPNDIIGESFAGLTQRDYFASQALVGLLASGSWTWIDTAVERAYKLADEMIKQRGE